MFGLIVGLIVAFLYLKGKEVSNSKKTITYVGCGIVGLVFSNILAYLTGLLFYITIVILCIMIVMFFIKKK